MEYPDPIEIEHYQSLEEKRRKSMQGRIRALNIVTLVIVAVCILFAGLFDGIKIIPMRIILPVFVFLFPLVMSELYIVRQTGFDEDVPLTKRPLLLVRMNLVGALFISIAINQYYFLIMGWREAAVVALCGCYAVAAALALRGIFGDSISPPDTWRKSEFIMKTVLLVAVAMIAGRIWAAFFPPDFAFGVRAWAIHVFVPLASISVFVPFYMGYSVAGLPYARKSLTKSVDKESLAGRFGDENMPGMQ